MKAFGVVFVAVICTALSISAFVAGQEVTAATDSPQLSGMKEELQGTKEALGALQERVSVLENKLDEETSKREAAEKRAVDLEESIKSKLGVGGILKDVGVDIRIRGEAYNNVWDFNEGTDADTHRAFWRERTQIWADVRPLPDLRGYFRLCNEYKWGDQDEVTFSVGAKDAFVDNAFVEWTHPYDWPFVLKLGRQDMMYGEGLLIMDGTPIVGSTCLAFDALKATYDGLKDWSIDVIWAKMHEFGVQDFDDEDVYGVYAKTTRFKEATLEPYVLYKVREDIQDFDPTAGSFIAPEARTWALGTRASGMLKERFDWAAEFVGQWGEIDRTAGLAVGAGKRDKNAIGGYARGTYLVDPKGFKPRVMAEFVYLEDDWDSFYAEWPKYSELYVYTLYDPFFQFKGPGVDPDVGTWTNIRVYTIGGGFNPTANSDVSLNYRKMTAIRNTGPGDGTDRGDLIQIVLKNTFNKYFSGNVWLEWLEPGDYYVDGADSAYYARAEVRFRF